MKAKLILVGAILTWLLSTPMITYIYLKDTHWLLSYLLIIPVSILMVVTVLADDDNEKKRK